MPIVSVDGVSVELPAEKALALIVRLRASGLQPAAEAATMLERETDLPTVWTKMELYSVRAVLDRWVGEGEAAAGDEILALRRAIADRLCTG